MGGFELFEGFYVLRRGVVQTYADVVLVLLDCYGDRVTHTVVFRKLVQSHLEIAKSLCKEEEKYGGNEHFKLK